MKAMVLTAPGHVEMQDVDTPVPAPGEALIRITHSGICGTDRKIYDNSIPVHHPLIMGHEMIGVIEEGKGGGGAGPGTRVTRCGGSVPVMAAPITLRQHLCERCARRPPGATLRV